jgi:hypothetical protein
VVPLIVMLLKRLIKTSARPSLIHRHRRHVQSIPKPDALAASQLYRLHLEYACLHSVK